MTEAACHQRCGVGIPPPAFCGAMHRCILQVIEADFEHDCPVSVRNELMNVWALVVRHITPMHFTTCRHSITHILPATSATAWHFFGAGP